MTKADIIAHFAALQWHVDHGLDDVLADTPGLQLQAPANGPMEALADDQPLTTAPHVLPANSYEEDRPAANSIIQGTPALKAEAIQLALQAQDLESLKSALREFKGNPLHKTATNLVFGEGSPQSPFMLIGETPSAEDDKSGRIFSGPDGGLLDKILKAVDLHRDGDDPARLIYLAHLVCWRPPGNRTPTAQEYELSLPFIEQQIALVKPRLLILCGGNVAKALLGTDESLSKLRNRWHSYTPRTQGLESPPLPALVTYGPANLLNTPSQKRAAWGDWLMIAEKAQELGIF